MKKKILRVLFVACMSVLVGYSAMLLSASPANKVDADMLSEEERTTDETVEEMSANADAEKSEMADMLVEEKWTTDETVEEISANVDTEKSGMVSVETKQEVLATTAGPIETSVAPYTMYAQTALNVRSAPDASAEGLFILVVNDRVTVTAEVDNGWVAVTTEERCGYCNKAYLGTEKVAVQTSVNSGASGSDTWYVNYYNHYGSSTANGEDVTQWADGYFIAHSNTDNGRRIASKPVYVVVDGRRYRYISCQYVPRNSEYTEELKSWAHANGGIAFQTCAGDSYLITHYEPV